jgi:hypothetical protein
MTNDSGKLYHNNNTETARERERERDSERENDWTMKNEYNNKLDMAMHSQAAITYLRSRLFISID